MRTAKSAHLLGMTLPELLVSTTIFGLVVVGSTGSALLLAKIATDHENRADFSTDIRSGMEHIAYDVRNADRIVSRTDGQFVLGKDKEADIIYTYNAADRKVTRRQNGGSRNIFNNVTNFDVLTGAADAPSGMTFKNNEIAIEKLELESANGTGKGTKLVLEQFALKVREI